jgi:hypothetical protein
MKKKSAKVLNAKVEKDEETKVHSLERQVPETVSMTAERMSKL